MQISVDQGNLLTMLVKAMRPKFAIEIGTFTGFFCNFYSARIT